jgi:Brp/Blh family beta-carotene 15,15'-monooxygenase
MPLTHRARPAYQLLIVFIVSVFILITLQRFVLSNDQYIFLMLFLIFMLGFPHGALDVIMLERLSSSEQVKIRWQKRAFSYGLYVSTVVTCIIFWIFCPNISLTLFLTLSVFHFRSDWLSIGKPSFGFLMASIFISGTALGHEKVLSNFFTLLGTEQDFITVLIFMMKLISCTVIIIFIGNCFFHAYTRTQLIIAIGLLILVCTVNPLSIFVAYFVFYHSIIHTKKVINDNQLSLTSLIRWLIIPMSLTCIIGYFLYHNIDNSQQPLEQLFYLIFIGLFALTIPHMVLSKIYELKI